MIIISLSICLSYVLLILISLYLDPKRRRDEPARRLSILQLLLFSILKMLLVIGIVIAFAVICGGMQDIAIGFSGFSFSWPALGFGIIAGFGFMVIYSIWQIAASRIRTRIRRNESTLHLVQLLPKNWLPLIGIFLIISLEAGVLEEVFFRGIIQAHLGNFVAAFWGAVASGVLFGIAHFYQGISGVVGTSVLGVWLGLVYAVTGNLLVPIIGHFLGDFACMLLGAGSIVKRKDS